ncbi:type II toxin-antitoxin system HipA family toxin [Aerophototrophica crusticola]|uniref:Type II toxin-antitoxin system HipA family toxin n=1 Tax=Aerophototrophica crusticola TaxID=1709002 RepID=A0A858RB24_9PROT|nr:type II toxin-antitoxin system HipA family toxin [Rhodospirillaceae bacterium B3]
MLKVWTAERPAGRLDRNRGGSGPGATFAYGAEAGPGDAVSLTMPTRLESYDQPFGLHPIFEMNLPEGALRERLRLRFAKATGRFDDLDLLAVTGRSQMGRIRYTAPNGALDAGVPLQPVDDILARRRDGDLFRQLLDSFAPHSGISGVQPKVLVRDPDTALKLSGPGTAGRVSFQAATHIVKFWDPAEYPHLAANEYFCLEAARRCGLEVARARLAEDGAALVVDRFDLGRDGTYLGMEDFCVLNGTATARKYEGGYEKSVFRRLKDFMAGDVEGWRRDAGRLFTLFVLNAAIRNGDAHLKNFAVLYDGLDGPLRLAPAYDLVTTTAYLPADRMALTLDGKPTWPDVKQLERLGTTRCGLTPSDVRATLERVADALATTLPDLRAFARDVPGFAEVATGMEAAWAEGTRTSLGNG